MHGRAQPYLPNDGSKMQVQDDAIVDRKTDNLDAIIKVEGECKTTCKMMNQG